MPNLHLSSMTVRGFRGIRETLDLQLGRRLTIIYGGNASGKSSLTQAIEFALSGQVIDHEDNPIAARYLGNAMDPKPGRVSLRLTDGNTEYSLEAATDETRGAIEDRFRKVGSVDWPERHIIPVTTTHITSQGTLARILAADAVTRNELSGLCTGAYLRSLLSRATRLADYFRQGATGRNMQSEIKEARAAFEAARVLHESLAVSVGPSVPVSLSAEQLLNKLATELALPQSLDIDKMVQEVDRRLDEAEQKLVAIQRLLVRMRDLGQYEVELSQLRALVNDGSATETALVAKRNEINEMLLKQRVLESKAIANIEQATATVAASERYQRSVSLIESLDTRLVQSRRSLEPLSDQIAALGAALQSAIIDQRAKSEALVRLTHELALAKNRLGVVESGIRRLGEVLEAPISESESRVAESEQILTEIQAREVNAATQLRRAMEFETKAEAEFKQLSLTDARFVAAAAELETFIRDDACSLCGHHHGTKLALENAIHVVREHRLSGSSRQREQFERASADRREKAAALATLQKEAELAEASFTEARRALETLKTKRQATLDVVREALTRQGLQPQLSVEALAGTRDDLDTTVSRLEKEIIAAGQAAEESRQSSSDLEREFSERTAEMEQLKRLGRELQEQIDTARHEQPEAISADTLSAARIAVSAAENTLIELEHQTGKALANLAEQDRLLTETRAQRAGATRRLEAIEGLLTALDGELQKVGATRDVAVLLALESATRQQRDNAATQKARSLHVRQELGQIERYRARIAASEQFRAAQVRLDDLHRHQARLGKRAAQFADLQKELEKAQSTTAEEVLKNVRVPVGIMFRAMTAGCQWDIEFALTDSGHVETQLLDSMGGVLPATAVLNSAYLNISAIALRIALASQQNWTALRTVVLDDPILEMDSLTQSALIDGLEAILDSPHSPWTNLQVVITTWSEDFAVLAAHKLAHMNAVATADRDEFLIYRLGSLPGGTVVPERHAPRWNRQATAA